MAINFFLSDGSSSAINIFRKYEFVALGEDKKQLELLNFGEIIINHQNSRHEFHES